MDGRSMMIGTEALLGLAPSNVVMTSGTMGFNTFAIVTDYDLDGASTLAQARELWMIKVRAGMRVLSLSPAWHALGLFESRAITRIGAVPILPWGTLTPRFAGDILTAVTLLKPEHLLVTARAVRMLLAECDRLKLDPRRAFASVRYLGCAGESLSRRSECISPGGSSSRRSSNAAAPAMACSAAGSVLPIAATMSQRTCTTSRSSIRAPGPPWEQDSEERQW